MGNKDLALKLNTSEQTVSGWVTNTYQPSLMKLFQIAHSIGVEPFQLVASWEYSGYPEGFAEDDEEK